MRIDIQYASTNNIASDYEAHLGVLDTHLAGYRIKPRAHFGMAARALDRLSESKEFIEQLAHTTPNLVVLGTGGASLGGQVLTQLAPTSTSRRVAFIDNLDAISFAPYLAVERLSTTRFLAISKSGTTSETLMQASCVISALQAAGLSPAAHFAAITGEDDNRLRQLANAHNCMILSHDAAIGGRFSVLTNVGLVPALWMGVDVVSLLKAADDYFAPLKEGIAADNYAPAQGAALQLAHIKAGRSVSILLSYADSLAAFGDWYCQLWSESLGKDGGGSLAVAETMPRAQHSQLQFYLDGADIGFYTLIAWACEGEGGRNRDGEAIGDLVAAHARVTRESLIAAGRPLRYIELARLDATRFGALLAHFMVETILMGDLCACDVFDQPAVEAGKMRAQQLMARPKDNI